MMKQFLMAAMVAVAGVAEARVAGPHQGRIVELAGVKLEFVLDQTGKAHVYALDAAGAAVDPGTVTVSIRAKSKSVPVAATTAGIDGANEKIRHFVTKAALPAGDGYEVVLTAKAKGKTGNARIMLVRHTCGGCGLAEYACICDH